MADDTQVLNRGKFHPTLIGCLDGALLAVLILLPLFWLAGGVSFAVGAHKFHVAWHSRLILLPLLMFALRLGLARGLPSRGLLGRPLAKKMLLAYVVLVGPFLGLELILKLAGFQADLPPIVVKADQYGGRKPRGMGMISHPEYRWIFKAGGSSMGHPINSLGFRDREVDPVKQPGVRRIICMGDSCTAQGLPPYSTLLHERLTNASPAAARWEAFNAAVIGFSSSQGLRLFQNQVSRLQPDIVTLYYGWNDHWWSGIYQPDSVVMARPVSPWTFRLQELLKNKRFYQFIRYRAMPVRNASLVHAENRQDTLRVPQAEYVWNLEQFVREIRALGADPILITAPRAATLHANLVERGNITSIEEGLRLHDEYAQLNRDVAAKQKVRLLDLHERMSGPEYAPYFMLDGIHFTQEGLALVAEAMEEVIRDQ